MYKRKCKYFERESWWYGRGKPEAIASSVRCKAACTQIFFECEKCPFYEPAQLNEDIAEFFNATCERYRKGEIMPIVCIALLFAPLLIATPMAIEESKKEQQINQMCLDKFNNPEDIKSCKAILMKMDPKR